MKIGFISHNNPFDKKTGSGTPYKMYEQLSKIGELSWIKINKRKGYKIIMAPLYIYNLLFSKKINWEHTRIISNLKYKKLKNTDLNKYDIIINYVSNNLIYTKLNIPYIYISDATFPAMVNYYEAYSNLNKFSIKEGYLVEKRALTLSDKVVFSSNWAKESAVKDLNIPANKINVIEFGANIEDKDISNVKKEFNLPLKILFLGVKWERKGGDLAVEAIKWLNNNGIPATLYIVGVKDLKEELHHLSYIKSFGFLDKNSTEDYKLLIRIFNESHLLLLPTKAECSAIAFAEASANGLPVFTHETGGISNYIIDGENGYLLPLGSTGKDFGKKIKESYENNELINLSETAVKIYQKKLNWDIWGQKMKDLISSIFPNYET